MKQVMKFGIGDKVRSTIEGISGELIVGKIQLSTFCYYVYRGDYPTAGFWIHEKDLEAVPKCKVGQTVCLNIGEAGISGVITGQRASGAYEITCRFIRYEDEITPV